MNVNAHQGTGMEVQGHINIVKILMNVQMVLINVIRKAHVLILTVLIHVFVKMGTRKTEQHA